MGQSGCRDHRRRGVIQPRDAVHRFLDKPLRDCLCLAAGVERRRLSSETLLAKQELPFAGHPTIGSGNASVAAYLLQTGLRPKIGSAYSARQGMQVRPDGEVAVRIQGSSIQIGGQAMTCIDGGL